MLKMKLIILNSGKFSSSDNIDVTPFLLSTDTENVPSFFEILFLIGDQRYRYGFEVDKNKVHSEWLYVLNKNKEKDLFVRIENKIEVSKEFVEGKGLEPKTKPNTLFLSLVDQLNGEISKKIIKWVNILDIESGIDHSKMRNLIY